MTLNGPTSLIDSKRDAVASGDAVEGDTEEYRPPIDELLSSAREDVARLAQILRQLHCSAVLRGIDGAPKDLRGTVGAYPRRGRAAHSLT